MPCTRARGERQFHELSGQTLHNRCDHHVLHANRQEIPILGRSHRNHAFDRADRAAVAVF